jgi:hypothetical protein
VTPPAEHGVGASGGVDNRQVTIFARPGICPAARRKVQPPRSEEEHARDDLGAHLSRPDDDPQGAGGVLTRRRFLYALGAVGGAGAVLGSMEVLGLVPDAADHKQPFQPPSSSDFHLQGRGNDTSVLILGAGDAGLAAAYELEKAGYGARCSRRAPDPAVGPGPCEAAPR